MQSKQNKRKKKTNDEKRKGKREPQQQPNKVYAPKKVARQATPSISNTDNSSSSNDNGKRTSFTRNTIKRGTAGIGKTKDNLVSTVKSVAKSNLNLPEIPLLNLPTNPPTNPRNNCFPSTYIQLPISMV